ncbi:MAG TPA: PH domain-containing protein [Pyrinomonadaceae bacterium]|jgi:membrane protein YdbS with pleckstrin-like domain|nr:PH domain-containing protein [Pyrinomonadaceae bacterium]
MDTCYNCGQRLTPSARFCAACGVPADSEETRLAPEATRLASEETRVARPRPVEPLPVRPLSPVPERRADERGGEEQIVFNVRPTLLFVKLGYALAALGGIALIALLAWQPWVRVSFLVSLPLALALLLIPAYKHLRRNTVSYTLTDSKIEIDQGLVSRTTRNIPLRNIQDVTVSATFFQRLLRFGNLVIDNASDTGGTTVLRNIPDPRRHADLLLRELRRWH